MTIDTSLSMNVPRQTSPKSPSSATTASSAGAPPVPVAGEVDDGALGSLLTIRIVAMSGEPGVVGDEADA